MNYKLLLFGFLSLGFARISAQTFPLQVKEEKLTYVTDERGNRILDYSSCGYRNSEHPIPDVANAVFVSWKPGDNSSRIQRAIDYVSSLALDKNGFRGAVLLDKGTFELNESLRISVSGVVLRGSDREQTVLLKKGVDRGNMAAQRKQIVAAFENWWDKYRVTLTEIESKRDAAAKALQGFLKGLRYV